MELNTELIAFIGILFIALVGIWALVSSNKTIANLIPLPLAQELIKTAVTTALQLADERAKTTTTTLDDELVALIREEMRKFFAEGAGAVQPPTPPEPAG